MVFKLKKENSHGKKGHTKFSTRISETLHFDCSPFLAYFFWAEIQRQHDLVYTNIETSLDTILM